MWRDIYIRLVQAVVMIAFVAPAAHARSADTQLLSRPANYYGLVYAKSRGICAAFAEAAAPVFFSYDAPPDPLLGSEFTITRDRHPWGSNHDGRAFPGYAKYWAIIDHDNSGGEHAVLQLVWKGHRWLHVLMNRDSSSFAALVKAFDLLAQGATLEQAQFVNLRVATQIRDDVSKHLNKPTFEETSLEAYSFVRLRGRNYLSAYTADARGRSALLLVGFSTISRAELLCILRSRS